MRADPAHAVLRCSDIAARVGGDEFVVVGEDLTAQMTSRQGRSRVAAA
ncbi:MAG TPA: hypothetical protein VFP72_16965 [Kineosporiaceae bacterium]|nr:hypothetical protein [Kineosporiaceae bacterium]